MSMCLYLLKHIINQTIIVLIMNYFYSTILRILAILLCIFATKFVELVVNIYFVIVAISQCFHITMYWNTKNILIYG